MNPPRALLLTDVVDSTDLARRMGETEAARCWAQHDRLARDLMRRWHGREVDRTDGMLMLFGHVADAVACALAYHAALADAGLPFVARAGVHAGALELRENSADDVAQGAKPLEVHGLAMPMVARVMTAAVGGQTLLSSDAWRELAADSTPGAQRCRPHGHWRLGGLGEPVELYEAVREGFAPAPPQDHPKAYRVVREGTLWRPVREIAHNLPAERDTFIGQQHALLQLATLLDEGTRLVTVAGMGGAGKTRLALRCAWSWLGEYPGGVWFCDLSPATDMAGLHRAVAKGLGVPLGRADPAQQLARAIAGRGRCLLILDNFEQVVGLAEASLGQWLDHAHEARFVATSRERLGLVGECVLDLPAMSQADAEALFQSRARAAGLPARQAEPVAVGRLVRMLDCLPLAIELAAARSRVMSPSQMLSRMHERFTMLATRLGRGDRRSTLRATIDWSWDLLNDAERAVLAQLSVFVAGFTLEACEAVAVAPAARVGDAVPMVDLLQSLVDKSLVRRVDEDRFDLLQSVVAYAADQLGRLNLGMDGAALATADRHASYFAALGPKRATRQACIELDNLMAACRHAVARGDGATASAALAGAAAALTLRGPFRALLDLSQAVLKLPNLSPHARLSALLDSATGHNICGLVDQATVLLSQAQPLALAVSDGALHARLLQGLAIQQARNGNTDNARAGLLAAMDAARNSGDIALMCSVLSNAGDLAESGGKIDEAREAYVQCLELAKNHGLRRWEGGAAGNLGQFLANQGDASAASPLYESAIAIASELGDRPWEANTRCNLGLLLHELGEHEPALSQLAQSLQAALALGYPKLAAVARCNLGLAHQALGQTSEAALHFEDAIDGAREAGDRRSEGQARGYLGLLRAEQVRFDDARQLLEAAVELLLPLNDANSLGIAYCQQALAGCLSQDKATAMGAVVSAEALAAGLARLEPRSEFGKALLLARDRLASTFTTEPSKTLCK